ncbi:MAG: hypothetical protein E7599_02975 [Ruminococcaceae bacterium]|nr:hypothetical protein [Oscillospiraceae bacterium]
MKKILGLICWSLIVVLICMTMPVFAATNLKITGDTVEAAPGETVTMTFSVSENPGFSYLVMTLKYDQSALTLDKVSNGTVMKDMDSGKNLIWSADDDSTACGTLVTLTFTVADSASGEYNVSATVRECYNIDFDDVDVSVTAGTITVAGGEQAPFGFAGHQVGESGIRFIGYTNSLEYDTIDLAITVEEAGKSFTKATKTVYTTLMGAVDGETKAVASCDPEVGALVTLDYDYLYGYAVTDIEAGEYVFTIVPTAILNGETLEGKTATLNVTVAEDGTVTVTK